MLIVVASNLRVVRRGILYHSAAPAIPRNATVPVVNYGVKRSHPAVTVLGRPSGADTGSHNRAASASTKQVSGTLCMSDVLVAKTGPPVLAQSHLTVGLKQRPQPKPAALPDPRTSGRAVRPCALAF